MKLEPVTRIKGQLRLPGDKSISHRVAIIAALAEGTSQVSNFSTSRDCASTLDCLRQLGVSIKQNGNEVVIEGGDGVLSQSSRPLDCGNSGSTIRMMSGVLAAQDFASELTGDDSLSSRPMRRIIEPLQLMGATVNAAGDKPPLTIHGCNKLRPITYKLPVASAQVKSCVLFAARGTEGVTEVIETTQSRDHTERLFNGFGVPVSTRNEERGNVISLHGPERFTARPVIIPGDISSASYFVAAAALLPGSELSIRDVGLNSTRAEYLEVLRTWGAKITTTDQRSECNEPVGTIHVRGGMTTAAHRDFELSGSNIPLLIDELPLLAVVGTQLAGGLRIRDAGELRVKESDRIAATVRNLRAMGAEVEVHSDGLAVSGPTRLRGALIESYGDHRIAMAFSVAALIAQSNSEIAGAECVEISFPEFFALLNSITEQLN